jgi:beta-glucosidase-like glycosyl hydrolase
VLATLKHMTGHGQPESGTNVGPVTAGERTLRDVFCAPFHDAIRHGVRAEPQNLAQEVVHGLAPDLNGYSERVQQLMLKRALDGLLSRAVSMHLRNHSVEDMRTLARSFSFENCRPAAAIGEVFTDPALRK